MHHIKQVITNTKQKTAPVALPLGTFGVTKMVHALVHTQRHWGVLALATEDLSA